MAKGFQFSNELTFYLAETDLRNCRYEDFDTDYSNLIISVDNSAYDKYESFLNRGQHRFTLVDVN